MECKGSIEARRNVLGFTMIETLGVVAITIILMAVAFVGIIRIQRQMKQTEMDGSAKEIYFAAQNHLSAAFDQGLIKAYNTSNPSNLGTKDTTTNDPSEYEVVAYYFNYATTVATNPNNPDDSNSVLNLMLPWGSLEEGIRAGGNYIIRYQPDTGMVLDVFFCDVAGFNASDYQNLMTHCRGNSPDAKNERQDFNGHVIGYYGGNPADTGSRLKLERPIVEVINGDKLEVKIINKNYQNKYWTDGGLSITLNVEGVTSGGKLGFDLDRTSIYCNRRDGEFWGSSFTVVLDDITRGNNGRFWKVAQDNLIAGDPLIPGEQLKITATASCRFALSNVATSIEHTTSSLYGDGSSEDSSDSSKYSADINSIRHLVNLGSDSRVKSSSGTSYTKVIATQKNDLSWDTFKTNTDADANFYYPPVDAGATKITYEGQGKSITGITTNPDSTSHSGLFAELANGSSVEKLTLQGFEIATKDGNAGALVGYCKGTSIKNVIAIDYTDSDLTKSKATSIVSTNGSAGGLVGKCDDAEIDGCTAAVVVTAGQSAGGLVGESKGSSIKSSYAGGHTKDGSYESINVVSNNGNAGGLVGTMDATSIASCYSTCSVQGKENAGGLIGSSTGGSIKNTYATGLVDTSDSGVRGAFIGSIDNTSRTSIEGTNNYLDIINNGLVAIGSPSGENPNVTAADTNAESYNDFVKQTGTPHPYDTPWLSDHYDRYPYKTISELTGSAITTHYGDWPSPETLVYNAPNP